MRIVQLTDIHIGAKNENTRNIDVRTNLKAVLKSISKDNADMVVLTGDLCFDQPDQKNCAWIKKRLSKYNIQPYVIPGNHDDSVMIAEQFDMPLKGDEVYFSYDTNDGMRILFLDTARGKMSPAQWAWFEELMITAEKLMIFMHHPPVYANMPFMDDNHAFTQQEQFQELVSKRDDCVDVFCGHYHIDKSITVGNLHVHITPSCFFQIRDDIEEFAVDHYRIGYRRIKWDGKSVSHSVRYP